MISAGVYDLRKITQSVVNAATIVTLGVVLGTGAASR